MYYLIYNNYGECPHIIDDIDSFYIDTDVISVHSVSLGDIDIMREAWNIIHLTYYHKEDYIFNQEVNNGKNQVH